MSYTWITPKTDWDVTSHFTYTDYNRIRNNLLFLNDMLNSLYPDVAEELDLGNPKSGYTNDYYASEFNAFEDALDSFKRIGQDMSIGERGYYFGNDSFISADGLNRLEKCCVRWFNMKPAIESVSLSPASFEFEVGQTKRLTLTVVPADAEYTVEWSSSNTAIATVNNGVVTAVANGSFTITATIKQMGRDDIVKTSNGAVIIDIQSITVTPEEQDYFGLNESKSFNVTVTPNNATHKDDLTFVPRATAYNTVLNDNIVTAKLIQTPYQLLEYLRFSDSYKTYYSTLSDYIDSHIGTLEYNQKSSNIFRGKIHKTGSWYKRASSSTSYYYCFQLIQKLENSPACLLLVNNNDFDSAVWGNTNRNDLNAPWRTVVQNKIDSNFSVSLKNMLVIHSNYYYKTATQIGYDNAKFWLPSAYEFGITDATHLIQNLGNPIPYLVNNKIYGMGQPLLTTRDLYYDVEHYFHSSIDDRYTIEISSVDKTIFSHWSPDMTMLIVPYVRLVNSIRVIELEERPEGKYYYFDWSLRSPLRLSDIPLGSYIIDITGTREHE